MEVKSFNSPSPVCAPTSTGGGNVVRSNKVELMWSDPPEVMNKEVVQ